MTRLDLGKFFIEFSNELKREDSNWTNKTLEGCFWETMEAYAKNIQGYYDNYDPNKSTWENFKTIFPGGAVYE